MRLMIPAVLLILMVSAGAWAQEPVDMRMIAALKMEGFQRSQVMDIAFQLSEVHGPRLHGTASLRAAAEWARDQLTAWGLSDARLESWSSEVPVWELESYSVELRSPRYMRFNAHPLVFTPSTAGRVEGVPVVVKIRSPEDLEQYRGQLRGKIVFNDAVDPPAAEKAGAIRRFTDDELRELLGALDQGPEPGFWAEWDEWAEELDGIAEVVDFFRQENAAALVTPSSRRNGLVRVSFSGVADPARNVPGFVIARDSWDMVARLVEKGPPPTVRLESRIEIRSGAEGHNLLADLPGSDPELADELVMLGGHLDAWPSGTGATDNAAGCAVAMEAMRILQAVGARPRRTVRLALWDGEEYDYGGSMDYVTRHLADLESLELRPAHRRVSAYFNLDSGTGRIRGVYLQGNELVRPIFEAWLEPFRYLGAETLTSENTSGTDHMAFDAVGVPGFTFIQDPLAYGSVTHHTDRDVYNQLVEDDLRQAAVIMASFVYHAAMRDEMLPRKQLPAPRRPPTTEVGG